MIVTITIVSMSLSCNLLLMEVSAYSTDHSQLDKHVNNPCVAWNTRMCNKYANAIHLVCYMLAYIHTCNTSIFDITIMGNVTEHYQTKPKQHVIVQSIASASCTARMCR